MSELNITDGKRKMVDLLMSKSEGKIVACNIIDAIKHNVVTEDDVKEFMGIWYSEFKKFPSASLKELIALIPTAARQLKKSDYKNFYVSGCKVSAENDEIKYHRITTYSTLLRNVVEKDALQRSLGFGAPILPSNVDVGNPALHRFIKRYASNAIKTTSTTGSIGPPDECFWATTDTDIKDSLAMKIKDRANRIRDLLGLVHLQPKTENSAGQEEPILMSIILEEKLLLEGGSRPCFIDAGIHSRFRTVPDDKMNKKKKEWGYTVDLMKLDEEKSQIDGVRECVVKSIKCSMLESINILPIGIVSTEIGNKDTDTDHLAKLMMSNRDRIVLQKSLLNLL